MENAERRLELIRMMRSEHEENIGRIRRREHILYPNKKLSYTETSEYRENTAKPYVFIDRYNKDNASDLVSQSSNWGFYLRLGISISLFLLFFYMDMNKISFGGISSDMVLNMISDTFDLKSFAFMK